MSGFMGAFVPGAVSNLTAAAALESRVDDLEALGAVSDKGSPVGAAFTDDSSRRVQITFDVGVGTITWNGTHLTANTDLQYMIMTTAAPGTIIVSFERVAGGWEIQRNSTAAALTLRVTAAHL